jgi:hypothetical protein
MVSAAIWKAVSCEMVTETRPESMFFGIRIQGQNSSNTYRSNSRLEANKDRYFYEYMPVIYVFFYVSLQGGI